jgi:hypothetical protein
MEGKDKIVVKTEEIVETIAVALDAVEPDEVFAEPVLYLTLHGLFNGQQWAVTKNVRQLIDEGRFEGSFTVFETSDHFSSQWMTREELVYCISDTSGLSEPYADIVLKTIEGIVDHYLERFSPVVIEFLGSIERLGPGGFRIELVMPIMTRGDKTISDYAAGAV